MVICNQTENRDELQATLVQAELAVTQGVIISLDFCLKRWYVTLLEGGEEFGAEEERHQSKPHEGGCFPCERQPPFIPLK